MGGSGQASPQSTSTSLSLPTGQQVNSNANGSANNTSFNFTPGSVASQQAGMLPGLLNTAQGAASNLPTSFNWNDIASNPYTQQAYQSAQNMTGQQAQQQGNAMMNTLGQQNQLNSSYGALQNYNFNNSLLNQQNQNWENSLNTGMQAFGLGVNTPLSVLSGAQNAYLQGLGSLYSPTTTGMQYQSSVAIPQQQQANNYALQNQALGNQYTLGELGTMGGSGSSGSSQNSQAMMALLQAMSGMP